MSGESKARQDYIPSVPALRKSETPPSVISAIERLEIRADKCYRDVALFGLPWNLSAWAGLTECIRVVELSTPANLYGTRHHINAATNCSMTGARVYKMARQYGERETVEFDRFRWTPRLATQAKHAFEVGRGYSTFWTVFPYWHADMYAAELATPEVVRFVSLASPLARRINAYQQGIRPVGLHANKTTMDASPEMQRLFANALASAVQTGPSSVLFRRLADLHAALYREHDLRTSAMMRRPADVRLGDYNLDEFRRVYSALNAIAAAHEFLCYLWSQEHGLPDGSLLLYMHRREWVERLSNLSGLTPDQVYTILKDVTFGRVNANDFHLLPFVPLTENKTVLAIAPFCSLSSTWEENVLRCLSRQDTDMYSSQTVIKEDHMRAPLIALTSGTRLISGPHKLPKPYPDIDLLVQDLDARILIVCELKWIRKPNGWRERQERDKEVGKGFQQIGKIREFIERNLSHLFDRRYIAWPLSQFREIHYCVVARDHLVEPPPGAEPICAFDDFVTDLGDQRTTEAIVRRMNGYEWLPVEPADFAVRFERHYAGPVAVESEVYYPAGLRMATLL